MAAKKEKLPLTVAPPEIRQGLKKIGERHGDKIGDEFKPSTPPNFIPKQKQTKEVKGNKKKKSKKEVYADKQRTLERRKRILRDRATEHELFFLYNLKRLKIPHQFQKGVIDKDHFMIPDFFIKNLNIVVEIDGCYHYSSKQQCRDYFKDKHYIERGFLVLRIKNEQVHTFDYDELKKSSDEHKPTEYLMMFLK